MSDKKELNKEQLNKVSGGDTPEGGSGIAAPITLEVKQDGLVFACGSDGQGPEGPTSAQ